MGREPPMSHEGGEMPSRRELAKLTRAVYEKYLEDWKRRNPRAVTFPSDYDHIPSFLRRLWKQNVLAAILGGKPRHPDQWVSELITREARGLELIPPGSPDPRD